MRETNNMIGDNHDTDAAWEAIIHSRPPYFRYSRLAARWCAAMDRADARDKLRQLMAIELGDEFPEAAWLELAERLLP